MPVHDSLDNFHQAVSRLIDASVLCADLGSFECEGDLGRGLSGVAHLRFGAHADQPAGLAGLVVLDHLPCRMKAVGKLGEGVDERATPV